MLTGENGRQVFLKAASTVAQAEIAAAYAEEIRKISVLADLVPAPRLEWFSSSGPWVLLGYEAVPSRPPRRRMTPRSGEAAQDRESNGQARR